MLGDVGMAAVRVFLILPGVAAAALIATVILYSLHFRTAFAIHTLQSVPHKTSTVVDLSVVLQPVLATA
jgi:hypothetical protein